MVEVIHTKLPGVVLFKPKIFGDHRGFFYESFRENHYAQAGLDVPFVQDNHSRSSAGVLRGLHYQYKNAQGKLVTITRGKVFDVAVDVRLGSPSYGQWVGEILSDENHHQLYIPPGFAHGFYVLSDVADFYYKCTDYYYPEFEAGVAWDDPNIAIDWPLIESAPVSLSQKDKDLLCLANISEEVLPKYP